MRQCDQIMSTLSQGLARVVDDPGSYKYLNLGE